MSSDSSSGGSRSLLSIPQLRKAFENVQAVAHDLTKGGKLGKDAVLEFTKIWHKEFGKPIGTESAEEYLKHLQSMGSVSLSSKSGGSSSTRKRTLKGGASPIAATAAPLDYKTEPGVYGTYGNFPAYVSGGFEVGVPRISQLEGWGRVDTTPTVPATIGSNQAGGGVSTGVEQAAGNRKKRSPNKTRRLRPGRRRGGGQLLLNTNPTTVLKDAVSYWHGQSLPPSPAAVDMGPRLII